MAIRVMNKPLLQDKVQQVFDVGNNVMVLTTAGEIYTLGQKADAKTIATVSTEGKKHAGRPKGTKVMKQEEIPASVYRSPTAANGPIGQMAVA